ncbi:endonuclease domain-containing protein [Agromyces sp. NPDC056523]|uniref:endonuclease domain-containing protein n=1 Tax=Agromyces sp. NPDC056523 TaxID=3345850 RepID=UPI00366DFA1F
MHLPSIIRRFGGIVHRADLYALGATADSIRAAVRGGQILRVRRDWVATPDAPAVLRRAVEIGGRLACISAASHLSLWTIDDGAFHVAAAPTASRLRLAVSVPPGRSPEVVHWTMPPVPVTARSAIDPIENVLVAIARCQPREHAVAVIDSALNRKLVRRGQLLRVAASVGGRFADVVADSDARADSGLETLPRLRLARQGIEMVPQVRIDGHQVDGLIGERLVLQFDGDQFHSTREQRQRDREQDARLMLQGFTVLRFGTPDVLDHWSRTEGQILSAIAQGLHLWVGPASLRPASQEIRRIAGGAGLI